MTFRVETFAGEPRITLTPADLEALGLHVGDAVTVTPAGREEGEQQFTSVSTAEALKAFEDSYAEHEESYRELAK